jgi:hypothetical protein
MSPVTFKQQIDHFSTEIARCISLCEAIRMNQKFASTHTNLDRLQNALEVAEVKIPDEYSTMRRKAGPLFQYGDDVANNEIYTHIQTIQQAIKPKLAMLAQPGKPRDKHPGFSKMHSSFQTIQASISQTMSSLSLRLQDAAVPQPAPRPTPAAATPSPSASPSSAAAAASKPATPLGEKTKTKKSDERVITLQELEHLLQFKRDSWEEIFMGGRIAYVNCFDPKNLVWERPVGGFIREVQRPSLSRKQSFERKSPGRRQSRSS